MARGSRRSKQSFPTGRGPHTFGEHWSWVQFWCAFLFAGLLAFFGLAIDALYWHLAATLAVASFFGALAGRYGDRAWNAFSSWFPWP